MTDERVSELTARCSVLEGEVERLQRELATALSRTIPAPPSFAELGDRDLLEAVARGHYHLDRSIRAMSASLSAMSEAFGRLEREVSEHHRTLKELVPDMDVVIATAKSHGEQFGTLLLAHARNHPGVSLVPPADDVPDSGTGGH